MNKDLIKEFNNATREFLDIFSSFGQEEINKVPEEGEWSAAQVAKHLLISDYAVMRWLNGNESTSDRQPDERIVALKAMFQDFSQKLKAPEASVPKYENYEKVHLVNSLKDSRQKISDLTHSIDLSKICTDVKMPVLQGCTRLEIIYFTVYHTQRHSEQLKRINNQIETKSEHFPK